MLTQSPKISKIIACESPYRLVDCTTRESFFQEVNTILKKSYPRFLIEDFLEIQEWKALHSLYPEFQFGLIEIASNKMVAQGSCIPIPWDKSLEELPNTGCDWSLMAGLEGKSKNMKPTILGAVSFAVLPEYQGQGLSRYLLSYMQKLARICQLSALILAVRPILKYLYPLTPIEQYICWTNEDGFAFDPWLRANLKWGAKPIGICHRSTAIVESISDWERTTEMKFPATGSYIISGAIVPLEIDCDADRGSYIEPNVWLSYQIV